MITTPGQREDYDDRQVEAARRVLVDLGQVLATFIDCFVVVGGWAPDLLLSAPTEPHIGSIDVDLVLDAAKLTDGRYAELLDLLLATKRYRKGAKAFQLIVDVDLGDGDNPVQVEVDFLAATDVVAKKNKPKLIAGFRVLRTDGCGVAFHAPVELALPGRSVRGAHNTVRLRVASLADFLVMKAYAIGGRDKPKDTYDLCYCLEQYPEGIQALALEWASRSSEEHVSRAIQILKEKFIAVDAFGPQQLIEFESAPDQYMRSMHARRAFELVQELLRLMAAAR